MGVLNQAQNQVNAPPGSEAMAPGTTLPDPGAQALSPGASGAPSPEPEETIKGGPKTEMEPATAEEQAEYERAMDALHVIMYEQDDTSDAIVKSLRDVDQVGVEPIVKMGILVIQQLDDAVDLDEAVIAQMTGEVVDRLIEIAETRYKVDFTEKEAQEALGATWEGVISLFDGADQQEFDNFTSSLHPDDVAQAQQLYQGLANG